MHIPLQGSCFLRNSSSGSQPPPTRTITELRRMRTKRNFWLSPNYTQGQARWPNGDGRERGREGGRKGAGRKGERERQGTYSVLALSHSGDLKSLLTGAVRHLEFNLQNNRESVL